MTSPPANQPRRKRHPVQHRLPEPPPEPDVTAPDQLSAEPALGPNQDFWAWLQAPQSRAFRICLAIVAILILLAVLYHLRHPGEPWHNDWPAGRQPRMW